MSSRQEKTLGATRSVTNDNDREQSCDDPLVQAVDEYLNAVDMGEEVELDPFLAAHPAVADQLRDCLEAFEFVKDAKRSELNYSRATRPSEVDQPFSVIGDYRIIREIGRGGMGVVYEAEQLSIRRKVALKVLPFAAVLDPRRVSRFTHEAQAAGALKHPHIVGVHAVGCERGVHYYAMELVEGKSLSQLIDGQSESGETQALSREQSTDPEHQATTAIEILASKATTSNAEYFRTIARLGVQAAEALQHAHEHGIVHRDIKPSNVMIDGDSQLWITDFGLAQMESDHSKLTLTGDVIGTLRYMSPEQASGDRRKLDHRTDIYSLGMTLYELLTGVPAFRGSDRVRVIRAIIESQPPLPRQLNSAIPRDLETIVLKAISKERSARYLTAGDMAADLKRFLNHQSVLASRPGSIDRLVRCCSRNKLVAGLSVGLIFSVAASVLALVQPERDVTPLVAPQGAQLALRLVHRGQSEVAGTLSPDGSRLAYSNFETANIASFHLNSGARHELTTDGTWAASASQYGEQAVWSHDSQKLAFGWFLTNLTDGRPAGQLRIMTADGRDNHVVYQPTEPQIVWPIAWAGDGRTVLTFQSDRQDRGELLLVDTVNGDVRELRSFRAPVPQGFQLSQNGLQVVYSQSPSPDETPHDLFLLDTQSGEVTPLIDHPANDYAPYWTPDGRWLVFLSDRGGSTGLWAVRLRDGKPIGDPRKIYSQLDDIVPVGFDKRGSYHYVAWPSLSNAYTAEVDFANNAVVAAPKKLESRYDGRVTSCAWSADGTRIADLARLGPQHSQPRITIRDRLTGSYKEIQPGPPLIALWRYSNLGWASDGKSLFITAADSRGLAGWFKLTLEPESVEKLTMPRVPPGYDSWSLSPDGRSMYLRRTRRIMRVSLDSGAIDTIYELEPTENDLRGLAVSHDGQHLLVATFLGDVRLLSRNGELVRVLYSADPQSKVGSASWALALTPDGQRCVFGLQRGDEGDVSLWHVPITGGTPKALGITMPSLRSLRIHPDGRRILFIGLGSNQSRGELWAIDNVLANLNAL